ncbi:MAG TPA: branched-chain amino acid transaminase, partial [Deinococcales bacterium]|nr:branched-chain amino acid transaminase [Deinococcales bacterium]
RLPEHVKRLFDSALILRMPMPFTREEVSEAILETVRVNGYKACYIRPLAFRGGEMLGVNPFKCPVSVMVAAWEWGAYLGEEAVQRGARVQTSSWARLPAQAMPNKAKAGGNYVNSALASMDAVDNGYDEALLLDTNGFVAEGSGENLFFLRDGVLHAIAHSVNLMGITRDSVLKIAAHLGIPVEICMATRDELYTADEVFMTGTAAEVTPIAEIDRRPVGRGVAGPVTLKIREAYLAAARGEIPEFSGWLTHVQ